jgi:hypothetical protein
VAGKAFVKQKIHKQINIKIPGRKPGFFFTQIDGFEKLKNGATKKTGHC